MSSSSGGSYPHEPPFFLPDRRQSQSFSIAVKSMEDVNVAIVFSNLHYFDNLISLRYKFVNTSINIQTKTKPANLFSKQKGKNL